MRKRMGTIYIYMYMYIFSCTNSDNIYPSGKSAIHCPVFLMSVDLFLLSLLPIWAVFGIGRNCVDLVCVQEIHHQRTLRYDPQLLFYE